MTKAKNRRKVKRLLQNTAIILAAFFLCKALIINSLQIHESTLKYNLTAVYTVFLLPGIFYAYSKGWYFILHALGPKPNSIDTTKIWFKSTLTRYIPGVVWSYISRVHLSKDIGISTTTCLTSIGIENGLVVSTAIAIGSISISSKILLSMLAALFFIFLIWPNIICNLQKLYFIPEKILTVISSLNFISSTHLLKLTLYYSILWIMYSSAFLYYYISLFPDANIETASYLYIACSFPAAYAVGLIATISPGGLGIRELTLYGLLTNYIPESEALVLAISSRLWATAGELMAIALFYFFIFIKKKF